MVPRLLIHSAGRQPQGDGAQVHQPDDSHARVGLVARRSVELRHLGGINGLYQVAGGITKPFRRRIQQKTGARTNTLSWRIGQVLTTFVLIDLSWIFFRANSLGDAMHLLSSLFRGWNTSIFFDGSLLKLGLDQTEWLVLLGALLILLAVSLMQEKGVSVLEAVKRQQLWFRWLIYLAAIFVVLLTGIYGPGFAASSFIYFQF